VYALTVASHKYTVDPSQDERKQKLTSGGVIRALASEPPKEGALRRTADSETCHRVPGEGVSKRSASANESELDGEVAKSILA
jgi:hypothetical protein